MVLTRASKAIITRSRGQVPDGKDLLAELPKKRKAGKRDLRSKDDAKRILTPTGREAQDQAESSTVQGPSRLADRPVEKRTCHICLEEAPGKKLVTISTCNHSFCKSCFKQLVRTNLKDKVYPMTCPEPDCNCHLDLEADIRPLFTSKKGGKEYAALLDVAAVSCIEEKDRFYCPNQACSALYQFTNNRLPARCKDVSRACHHCKQKFCMRCQVPWHDNLSCTAFQALPAEERSSAADIQVHALAKTENWKRCPSCRFFVERLEGCAFMACHCGCNFDYNTGQAYENGIGPAHLFAPEWVDDHLAMMAANLHGVMAAVAANMAAHEPEAHPHP